MLLRKPSLSPFKSCSLLLISWEVQKLSGLCKYKISLLEAVDQGKTEGVEVSFVLFFVLPVTFQKAGCDKIQSKAFHFAYRIPTGGSSLCLRVPGVWKIV